jgi:prepilin-type N-terminal cleavage/methylation domain-containing protein
MPDKINRLKLESSSSSGFTLLEIAIVIMISGILLAPLAQLYTQYMKQKAWSETKENIDLANAAIMDYRLNNNRYPCPADRTLPRTDPNYGRELRNGANGSCVIAGGCNGGAACRASNGYDTDNIGGPDNVLIGALPYTSLGINLIQSRLSSRVSQKTALDGYDNKLEYAVSESLTDAPTYRQEGGAVIVNQQDGSSAILQSTVPGVANHGAHYLVFSHGSDGNGAFSADGVRVSACGPLTSARDNENCNDDAIFMQGVANAFAPGPNYYDDFVKYRVLLSTSLWVETGPLRQDIRNTNTGNVGVNTADRITAVPQQRLDVQGNLKASGNLSSVGFCDPNGPNGSNCFTADVIGAPVPISPATAPIQCTAGAMSGISKADEKCRTVTFTPLPLPAPAADMDCSPKHVIGIYSNGKVKCEP